MKVVLATVICALGLGATAPAHALDPFEIQIYEGDINDPRQPGVELHANYVALEDGPAGEPPAGIARLTLEPSFGVLSFWELGAYLQFGSATDDVGVRFGGWKLRSKLVAPRAMTGDFVLGLNIEVGRGSSRFGGTDWDTEFRPILVWAPGPFLVAFNPIVGWALSGERSAAPDFDPAAKIAVETPVGVRVGIEYYAALGLLSDLLAAGEQEHTAFLVADLGIAGFDLNAGLGRSLTDSADPSTVARGAQRGWMVKTILGRAF